MAFELLQAPILISRCILMQIGLAMSLIEVPQRVMLFFLALLQLVGHQKNNIPLLSHLLKQSIRLLLVPLMRPLG